MMSSSQLKCYGSKVDRKHVQRCIIVLIKEPLMFSNQHGTLDFCFVLALES